MIRPPRVFLGPLSTRAARPALTVRTITLPLNKTVVATPWVRVLDTYDLNIHVMYITNVQMVNTGWRKGVIGLATTHV